MNLFEKRLQLWQFTVHRLYQAGTPQFNRRARGDAGANEQAGIGIPSLYYTM